MCRCRYTNGLHTIGFPGCVDVLMWLGNCNVLAMMKMETKSLCQSWFEMLKSQIEVLLAEQVSDRTPDNGSKVTLYLILARPRGTVKENEG